MKAEGSFVNHFSNVNFNIGSPNFPITLLRPLPNRHSLIIKEMAEQKYHHCVHSDTSPAIIPARRKE
jgi:hypothetical protein